MPVLALAGRIVRGRAAAARDGEKPRQYEPQTRSRAVAWSVPKIRSGRPDQEASLFTQPRFYEQLPARSIGSLWRRQQSPPLPDELRQCGGNPLSRTDRRRHRVRIGVVFDPHPARHAVFSLSREPVSGHDLHQVSFHDRSFVLFPVRRSSKVTQRGDGGGHVTRAGPGRHATARHPTPAMVCTNAHSVSRKCADPPWRRRSVALVPAERGGIGASAPSYPSQHYAHSGVTRCLPGTSRTTGIRGTCIRGGKKWSTFSFVEHPLFHARHQKLICLSH